MDLDYAMLLTRDKTQNLLDIEMLSRLQMHRQLSDNEIVYLRKRKLVEGGRMHFFAKSVARATGQKAEYTRKKGFDDDYYKDLIIKSLEQHVSMSRPDINYLLLTKLPESLTDNQKITKIGHLFTTLRKANKKEVGEKRNGGSKSSLKIE